MREVPMSDVSWFIVSLTEMPLSTLLAPTIHVEHSAVCKESPLWESNSWCWKCESTLQLQSTELTGSAPDHSWLFLWPVGGSHCAQHQFLLVSSIAKHPAPATIWFSLASSRGPCPRSSEVTKPLVVIPFPEEPPSLFFTLRRLMSRWMTLSGPVLWWMARRLALQGSVVWWPVTWWLAPSGLRKLKLH